MILLRMRVLNQRVEIEKIKTRIKNDESCDTAYVITDFKMKYTPVRYRETSQQHFAKRGMSWNGFMILYRTEEHNWDCLDDTQRESFDHMYFDLLSSGDSTQDYFMVLSGLEVMLSELHKELPYIKHVVVQSDNAKCYQSGSLFYGIAMINQTSIIKIKKFTHTETQDGKCSIDAHFAIAMAHILKYVAMGNNCVTPTQLIVVLNSNGGLANTKAVLYTVNRDTMQTFEDSNCDILRQFKGIKRSNEIMFNLESVKFYQYSGLAQSSEIRIFMGESDHEQSVAENSIQQREALAIPEDTNEFEEGYYDDVDNSGIQTDVVIAEEFSADDEVVPSTGDDDEQCYVLGVVTKVQIVPPGLIQKRSKRWKRRKRNDCEVIETLIQDKFEDICCICHQVFVNANYKEQHVCKGSNDPQDIISFAIILADKLVRQGDCSYIQRSEAIQERALRSEPYETFKPGWALRPKQGTLYGKKYISKYAREICQMFEEGLRDKAMRMGPNRMLDELSRKYPNVFDLPSESEIRSAISQMMMQVNTGKPIALGNARGRKSTFPLILDYIIRIDINSNIESMTSARMKPAMALPRIKEKYNAEYLQSYPISTDEFPSDLKIKQRFSALKQKQVTGQPLQAVLPCLNEAS